MLRSLGPYARTMVATALLLANPAATGDTHVPSAAFPLLPPLALAPNACDLPYFIDERGVQRLLPHCFGQLALSPPALEAAPSHAPFPPFPCDVPYRIDAGGVRRLILQCPLELARSPEQDTAPGLDVAPGSCELPYRVDAAGIRRIKPECLDL